MAIRAPRLFQATLWLPCLLILSLFITFTCALSPRKPRLSVLGGHKERNRIYSPSLIASDSNNNDYQTFYYDQMLDHFNYQPVSYTTFQQRYVVNFKHWRGAQTDAPIFAYMGEESSLDDDVGNIGFMPENSRRFGALELYIEHRYYGKSIPHGFTGEESLENATIRGYLSSAQAIADYAEIIINLKKNLSADSSPVIVVGGSYGGMLAAWFRLKYPHIAMGALASSAPILYFDDIVPQNSYDVVVTKDFQEVSWSCYDTVKRSWSEIDRVAAKPNGLSELSKKFKTCKPIKKASELKDYLEYLYSVVAQYDSPPDYPVTTVCKGIDGGANGTDILGRIFSGVIAYYGESRKCYDLNDFFSTNKLSAWDWQTCSELVSPFGRGNETIFQASPFDYNEYKDSCMKKFGVEPRPHWATTYYGGQHIKMILKRFGSNIIFTNGLRDPYSNSGVLENISDTILAVYTKEGSHCLDIVPATADDPKWLTAQRNKTLKPESYTTFRQRYIVNFTHWGGAKKAAAIFVYLGGESTSDNDVGYIGFMMDNARRFGGLEVYAEHRFYGQSIPHGFTREGALKNATIRGYFNSNQALADYAELIVSLKKNLSADSSPVLVAGGSYSGELATWFRLKYPHIAMGALASSAPILYFDDLVPPNSYFVVVTQDFQEASWSCYETVKSSWSEIDRVAAKPNGLSELSKKFKTCKPLKKASELTDYLNTLYTFVAQYDSPPDYPVDTVCRGIDGGANGTDILGRIFSGVVAYYGESKKCYDLGEIISSEILDGWDWQTCSEEVTIIGCGPNETMFPEISYDYKDYKDYCVDKFGVEPAPHWVTAYYGGEHIKRVLHKFGSNIIFTNGLRDPYSSAGILEDISDTLVALTTKMVLIASIYWFQVKTTQIG